jgi:hypothetical protein
MNRCKEFLQQNTPDTCTTNPEKFPPPTKQIQQQNGTLIYQGYKTLLFLTRRRIRVLLGRDRSAIADTQERRCCDCPPVPPR